MFFSMSKVNAYWNLKNIYWKKNLSEQFEVKAGVSRWQSFKWKYPIFSQSHIDNAKGLWQDKAQVIATQAR